MRQICLRIRPALRATLVVVVVLLSGCANMHESQDFERHRYSELSEPYGRSDVLYYDVRFDPNYPADDPIAEEVRMQWLEHWLAQRKMCANGFEIENRRAFDPLEDNPGHYDMRYEVRCKVVKPT